MTASQSVRPRFFEEQFLDAEDLTALVEYSRLARARHDLGAHTWGIGIGLQLAEIDSPGGVEVYVQPGYAWDGFGRPVVINSPYKISAGLFSSIPFDAALDNSQPSGRPIEVWVEYIESPVGGPSDSSAVCSAGDQYSRIAESFRLRVGDIADLEDRRDPVIIGGRTGDAQEALKLWGGSSDQIIADASIPHQSFPKPEAGARWLIPLGVVRWLPPTDSSQSGEFILRSDADVETSNRKRRYAGVVAETVNASRGFIRLRNRFSAENPRVWSDDLVWCEGSLRVEGDTSILGGSIALKDANNGDSQTPFTVRRIESNPLPPGSRGKDLLVQIGSSDAGKNRLVVGPVQEDGGIPTEVLVVRDNGNVGIGSSQPDSPLTVRGTGDEERSIGLESADGREAWTISQKAVGVNGLNITESSANASRFMIRQGGNIGVNTPDPSNQLHVSGNTGIRQNRLYISGGDRASNAWCSMSYNAHHNTNNSGWVFPDPAKAAVSVEMDDRDGTPRFVVQTTTTSNKTTWVPRFTINGNSGAASINGSVDINGGMDINGRVDISGRTDITGGSRIGGSLDVGGPTTIAGNTGIGIEAGAAPAARLHVVDSRSGAANHIGSHVSCIENTSTTTNADVLALKVGHTKPTEGSNFITFFGGSTAVGAIEGNSAGGIKFKSTGADYAEWVQKLDSTESFETGDIVGIVNGCVTHSTSNADHLLAISSAPIILGNTPKDGDTQEYEQVAMMGQVPVKVRGLVNSGDFILASGQDDGVGIAVSPEDISMEDFGRVLGAAWEGSDNAELKLIRVGIGLTMNKFFAALVMRLATKSVIPG